MGNPLPPPQDLGVPTLGNLPHQLTSFVGREREIAKIKQLLGTTHLLTLTGPGGCGKTRLALQVAHAIQPQYADGVWLIELVAMTEPAIVPQTVASTLNVREQPNRALTETLADFFSVETTAPRPR